MTTNTNFSQTAAFIWSVADLLRGDFKQSQYGRVILPFTLLRRLECALEESKDDVVAQAEKVKAMNLPKEAHEKILLRATNGLSFFNTSPMNLEKMGQSDIKDNLENYIQCFSKDAREIFEHFKFDEFVGLLDDANLLYKIVKKFATTDLSPKAISNHDMGLVFEELIRRFAESSNETAGEHFTPRDIVRLTTSLVFMEDDDALTKEGIIRTIYDPTAGTGGFLSSGMEYVHELNPKAVMRAFGQELNPESYAICKADMLIKGQDVSLIKLGNTLSNDQLPSEQFDYMLANPPFGLHWKKIEDEIKGEHIFKGFDGRFGAGLPRASDGSLLFLMHLISKMRDTTSIEGNFSDGSRIGIILNGSPMFSGGAGSGESKIRRHILEADLLEAIIALPTDMHYSTGIASYIWVISNKKEAKRKGKVQLIDASNLYGRMRKSLGSKRNLIGDDDIKTITRVYGDFEVIDARPVDKPFASEGQEKTNRGHQSVVAKVGTPKPFASKIFNTYQFGYRRLTIERPLRLAAQITDQNVESLRFAPKPFDAVMKSVYDLFETKWTEETYGHLKPYEEEVRILVKSDFPELKEKQIKDLLDRKIWVNQKTLMEKAEKLKAEIGTERENDFNQFEMNLRKAYETTGVKLSPKERKQFLEVITWKSQDAEPVIKKVIKEPANPIYGLFNYKGKVVEFEQDSDLRDFEDVPLLSGLTAFELAKKYFLSDVKPHAEDAWLNACKKDDIDGQLGVVGYRINFQSYFQKIHPRDKLLQGNIVRLKELVRLSDTGAYIIEPFNGMANEFSGLSEQRKKLKPARFDFYQEKLLPDFYNIFIKLEEGKDWLDGNFMPTASGVRNVAMSTWLNTRISIPTIGNQSKLIDFWEECEAVLNRVSLLKNSIFRDFQSAQEQLSPYQSVASRYEQEFSSMLPTPLAILWELAESKFNERERSEEYIKFFEYLGLYLVSIVFGEKKPLKNTFCNKKGEFKSLTMAFGYNRLAEHMARISSDRGVVSLICRSEIIELLREATQLRNDIAHRGLPSAAAVKKAKENAQRLIKTMQLELREFFETTTLIKAIQAKYDGSEFLNEVEVLKGLGLNPSKTAQLKTSEPMISEMLYLAHGELSIEENVRVTQLFPLMVMHETLPDSEIMGFYFYSDEHDGKLRFVCPYPNVETYKFFDQKLLKDNLDE